MSVNNDEISKIFKYENYKKTDFLKNLDNNNSIKSLAKLNSDTLDGDISNVDSFRKYYLFQTKKYFVDNHTYGLVHIRLAFFVKYSIFVDGRLKLIIDNR